MSINSVSAIADGLKYINGADVTEEETSIVSDVKSSVFNPITVLFGAMEVNSSLKTAYNAKNIKEVLSSIKSGAEATTSCTSTSITEQLSSAISNAVAKADAKTAEKAAKAAASTAETAVAEGTSSGIFSTVKSGLSKAGSLLKSAGSKVSSVISKIPGASKISEGVSWLKNTKFGKVMKGTGASGIMIFEGIIGLVTEVIPAFVQGGVDSGLKQLAQTGVKTVASGLGWAGGTVAATAIGSAIGSLILPGLGTTIGGAIGTFIGGIIGSSVASGIADKIIGETELEKLEDEQYEEAAASVAQDSTAMSELNTLVSEQVQTEIANGTADEDTEKMAEYLNSGAFTVTGTTSTSSDYSTSTDTTTTASTDASYWAEMAEKAAEGDTSIYDISDEDLEALFTDSSTSTTSSSDDDIYTDDDEQINYFATD